MKCVYSNYYCRDNYVWFEMVGKVNWVQAWAGILCMYTNKSHNQRLLSWCLVRILVVNTFQASIQADLFSFPFQSLYVPVEHKCNEVLTPRVLTKVPANICHNI